MKKLLFGCLVACFLAARVGAQTSNPIQQENSLPGTSAWQIVNPATNHEIEGYASAASINRGDQISLFVNTSDPIYQIELYRMGWYQGLGGRLIMRATLLGYRQVTPRPDPTTGLVECAWGHPYTLNTQSSDPSTWVSGYYLVKLTGAFSGKQSYIIFVVRDDQRHAPLLFQASVNTYQAYNGWGGKSLYPYNSTGGVQAVKVSFNRPYQYAPNYGAGQFFVWEYNMVRFIEHAGYDVSYSTDVDTHANGPELLWHKGILIVGHGEYWSWEMRTNMETARDRGVNLGFFAADTCSWQIRFEPSTVDGTPDRNIVGYKQMALTADPDMDDPATYYLVTTLWGRSRNGFPGWPEAELIGASFVSAVSDQPIVVQNTSNWVFRGTGLQPGDTLKGLLGNEVDGMSPESPPNTIRLGHSPFLLKGKTYYSDMTLYEAPSGAYVFATGTNRWSWGLDGYGRPATYVPVNPAVQQITRNVLNWFSVSH